MKKEKKTIKEEKWKNPILMEIERITLDCHLNSISQEEARDEIWKLFRQTLQRFIEETKIEEKRCPICHKVVDESWRGYDGHAECPNCIENDRYDEFDDWCVQNDHYFKWDDIGYNQVLKDIKQKQAKWLKENL